MVAMSDDERLVRRFKDEAVAVHAIIGGAPESRLRRYVVSTRDTRNLMNYPEIINIDFTKSMSNGITNALKALNVLEHLSVIDSRTVNVYHILRGGLNFQLRRALNNAFGYKWHSSSYVTSQRVLSEGHFASSDNSYRKFLIPDDATLYSADIVASGVSLDNGIEYVMTFLDSQKYSLRNMVFITIGCVEAERVLEKWDRVFRARFPEYDRTILIYLEGRFALATDKTPLRNCVAETDLLKSHRLGALLSPEFERSQFEKMTIGLEGCVIYDGGKKGFEPINHIREVLHFWERQLAAAEEENLSLWEEYNARLPLDSYFRDVAARQVGDPELFRERRSATWNALTPNEAEDCFARWRWLWSDERIEEAARPGSLAKVCRKKISYLKSLIEG
jgi:hypothetical protein